MRSFGQIPTVLWRTPGFVKLSDDAKLALMFLYCGPNSTSSGVFWLDDGVAASILKWDVGRWIVARMSLAAGGFISRSEETSECFVMEYLKTNRPKNKAAWDAVHRQISATICPELKADARSVYALLLAGDDDAPKIAEGGPEQGMGSVCVDQDLTVQDEAEQALDAYNDVAEKSGLPKAQRMTDVRRRALTARLKECGGMSGWVVAMEKVRASDFLTGKIKPWRADLDFILQAASFTKIMEGTYDNRPSPQGRAETFHFPSAATTPRDFEDLMSKPIF